jgi:hypothetical protein
MEADKQLNVFGFVINIREGCRTTLFKKNNDTVTLTDENQKGESYSRPIFTLGYKDKTADEFIKEFDRLKTNLAFKK